MSSSTLPTTNLAQEIGALLPRPPIVSSQGAGWNQVYLIHSRQPAYCIPEHVPFYHTICINDGNPVRVKMTVDEQSETVDSMPGDIGIYPANFQQKFQWNQEATFIDIFLETTILTETGLALCDREIIELKPKLNRSSDPLIYQIAVALKTALKNDGVSTKLYGDAMATALAAHLLTQYSSRQITVKSYSGGLSEQKLSQVTDYIQEYLDRDLSLAELAHLVQLSPYHFARLFKQSTGLAPHKFHLQCRVERAKRLLLAGELSLAEIACVVGFSSQGHFNYHFKRFVGVTPTVFLRQL